MSSEKFIVNKDGVHTLGMNDEKVWICDPIEAIAKTRNKNNDSWGKLFEWKDDDGVIHREIFTNFQLLESTNEVKSVLANGGFKYSNIKRQKETMLNYLHTVMPSKKALIVDKLGWHNNKYLIKYLVVKIHQMN